MSLEESVVWLHVRGVVVGPGSPKVKEVGGPTRLAAFGYRIIVLM